MKPKEMSKSYLWFFKTTINELIIDQFSNFFVYPFFNKIETWNKKENSFVKIIFLFKRKSLFLTSFSSAITTRVFLCVWAGDWMPTLFLEYAFRGVPRALENLKMFLIDRKRVVLQYLNPSFMYAPVTTRLHQTMPPPLVFYPILINLNSTHTWNKNNLTFLLW